MFWKNKRDKSEEENRLKKMVAELDRASKLLVRRDLELTRTNAELDDKYKELKAEKKKIEGIFMSFSDGLFFFDSEGNIRMVNPMAREIFDIKEEAEGFDKLILAIKDKRIKKILTEKDIKMSEEIKFNDWFLKVVTVSVEDAEKSPIGYLKVIHDITREKEIDNMKSEFISVAAHQLRTPLTGIKWTIKMVLDGDAGELNNEQADLLQKVYKSNERIIRLVNDLLNVSRIEEGRFGFEFKTSSFNSIFNDALKLVDNLAKAKRIDIQVKRPKNDFTVYMDAEKIGMAVANILDNAAKYTPEFGRISIETETGSKNFQIIVRDNGVGISEEDKKRIFTKFFRGSNVMRTQTEGTGLGLFLAKNIIEKHKGKIDIKSEEGKGTEVKITLPIK